MSSRKQKRLNLQEKVQVLKKLDSGVRANRVALDFGVTEGAISQIKKQKEKIYAAVSQTYQEAKKKTLHKAEYEELETKLYEWFCNQRERNCPINGPLLKAKAMDLFSKLYLNRSGSDFNASEGWLHKFKRRHGMRFIKVCGEILSSDTTQITPFIHTLRAKMDEMKLTHAQIYNADESGLFYRMIPDKTYVAACEKTAPGRKIRKERFTFMLCANADGTNKVKPLVIGKAAKPRCFVNFDNPLDYDNSATAWMTSKIFYNWFHGTFVKEVRRFSAENNLPPKAIILLDNCSAHAPIDSLCSEDGNIIAMLLPPNVTAVIQPMDQNPIKITKLKYRNKLLAGIVAQEGVSIHDMLKNHSIRDAILLLKLAWDELPQSVLQKSWSKLLNWDDEEYDGEDDVPLTELFSSTDIYSDTIQETQHLLARLAIDCEVSTDEIEEWNADEVDENAMDTDMEDEVSAEDDVNEDIQNPAVRYTDALNAVNTLIKWNEHHKNLTNKHMSNLLELRSDIVKNHLANEPKQTVLTNFFSNSNSA